MAVKKSNLYSKLWESCNTLRSKGGMDATQYKDYVLIILFMKVITDKYYGKKNSIIEVPDDANFNTMIALKNKVNIGEEFNKILKKIATKNDLQDVIDIVDFNDETKLGKGKDKIDALTGLVEIFQNSELDFSNNRADDDDILGDAYEYLMKKFATEAGKSKGQFYTPSEVSRVMAKIIGINKAKKSPIYVYDMTCGSGSLLLKAGAEAPKDIKVELYGQEKDNSTAGLAMMNMFLHGNPTAVIKSDNTLTKPQFLEKGKIKTFDYCVANPPFSIKKWRSGMENQYNRFSLGLPPDNCADYAFLLHMLTSMDSKKGRGTIILPHGVLFRGGQEAIIRTNLINSGYIEGIIGLPANLFYGTGIPACIIVLDKKNAANRKDIFMINASKNFIKDGNKNRLREEDIKKITDTYLNRIEEDKYSKIVSIEEIEKEEFNLNIPRYIDSSDEEQIQDIKAHLLGGIPIKDIDKYEKYWNVAPKLKEVLFKPNEKEGYLDIAVSKDKISNIINNSEEIKIYSNELNSKINTWENNNKNKILEIDASTRVKDLIEDISSNMLNIFSADKLIDKYDAYQYLMEYYEQTMKDDFYMIVDNGWIPQLKYGEDKNGNIKKHDFDSELLPKQIIIKEYFYKEQNHLDTLNDTLINLQTDFDNLINEHTGEDDGDTTYLFKEDDKVNEKTIKNMIKDATADELAILKKLLDNLNIQKEIRKKIKESIHDLNEKIIKTYSKLNETVSKDLLINKKWFHDIEKTYNEKIEAINYDMSNNIISELENYEITLSELINQTKNLEAEVLENLKRMGY